MKNILQATPLIILMLASCSEKNTVTTQQAQTATADTAAKNLFETDSVVIADSLKISDDLTASFRQKTLVFPNITDKILLDSIYAQQNINSTGYSKEALRKLVENQKQQYYKETEESLLDFKPAMPQTWERNASMKVFSTLGDIMALKYTSDGYTGGAHGYYNEIYKVFDAKSGKTLQLSDVISVQDPVIWGRILMTQFLQNDLEKGQAQMLLVKEIPLNNNFYFDENNLYFLYNQYEIAAYAAGPVLIKVPYTEIKPFLNVEFRNRLKLK